MSPSSSSAALVCKEGPGGPNLQLWGFYSCLEQPTWDSPPSERNAESARECVKPSTPCVHKPGAAPLVKVKTSRAQSANGRKQVWDYWHRYLGISPGERWSLSPGALSLLGAGLENGAREKQEVLI